MGTGAKRKAPESNDECSGPQEQAKQEKSKLRVHVRPEQYEKELSEKVEWLQHLFEGAMGMSDPLEVVQCPLTHGGFRMRAEFAVKRKQSSGKLFHAMFDSKSPVEISSFPMGSSTLQWLMRHVLHEVELDDVLAEKLFQINYLTTLTGDALVVLLYHKKLTDGWVESARALEQSLGVSVMGRARKQRIVLSKDYVTEQLCVNNEIISLMLPEGQFSQPNSCIAAKMGEFVQSVAKHCPSSAVLEMYCGSGTLTIPASRVFTKVLATEVAKPLVHAAQVNAKENNATNITFARLGAEEVRQAMTNQRRFRRLEDAKIAFNELDTALVDPPRAGCGEDIMNLLRRFSAIIYISCNPETCRADYNHVRDEFFIRRISAFDQFPYTPHLECGILLLKRDAHASE